MLDSRQMAETISVIEFWYKERTYSNEVSTSREEIGTKESCDCKSKKILF